jgi:1-deoxyxylulose-5-phosphate synthase
MQYASLGNTGTKVSRICLGCMSFGNSEEWMVELEESKPILSRAVDLGINFFDTANVYSQGRSEEILGTLLKGQREQAVIATKVYFRMWDDDPNGEGLSRKHIMHEIDASLKRLQTDRVDLYQIHRWDYTTPIEETLRALADIVRSGRALYTGASSMWAWQFAKSLYISDLMNSPRFVSMQNQYNLAYREEEREMIPLCRDQKIALIPWSPLARGFLSGRYKRGESPDSARYRGDKLLKERFFRKEDFDVLEVAQELAKEKGVSSSQIALAWIFHKKDVTAPIVGATKVKHVEEAVEALEVKLTSDEMKRLEIPYKTRAPTGFK